MIEIICAAIASISGIIVAIVGRDIKRADRKAQARADEEEKKNKIREKQSLLQLRMTDASLQLSVVSANALTNGHNNGNVEKARVAAENAFRDYEEFLHEIAMHEVVN